MIYEPDGEIPLEAVRGLRSHGSTLAVQNGAGSPTSEMNTALSLSLFSNGIGRRRLGVYWFESRDADEGAREIFHRHYSYKPYRDGRDPKHFVGPGEKVVLITEAADALFVWRKFKSADGQIGVNCAVFRNESNVLSSALILDAEVIAQDRWPGARLFTYVNPRKIKSKNPGACFKKAGWRQCGITKWNRLVILEKSHSTS